MKKISINKLAEYLDSEALRRRRIIQEQKEPLPFIVTRYKEAKNAIINFIISNYNENIIDNTIEILNEKKCVSDFEISDRNTSIEALESFLEIKFPDTLLDFKISKPKKKYSLKIKDLNVNINPDLLIRGKYRGKNIVGGIKIHISKTHPLNSENRKNVATMIHKVIEDKELNDEKKEISNLNFCISIDVFNSEYDVAPKSYKKRRKNIEFACDEIGFVWDKID
ncbi:hypothetical protein [uncultured Aquimarina sp.]|uniref:hypothetical protein n=1 Tax=uncultured Aquimarina sp. TaxID=575652 RepID=UPI0026083918|nr:hypothetical protein [uncultured Aquimarina sp.]